MTSYRLPAPPQGFGSVRFARTPKGEFRLGAECNLATVLHGPGAKAGSLTADELPAAIDASLASLTTALETPLPPPAEWDLRRVDPSVTYATDDGLPASAYVLAFHAAARLLRSPQHVLSLHESNGQTATWRLSNSRSWSVYDKGAEAGLDFPAVRFEARLRPHKIRSADFAGFRPTLDLKESDMSVVTEELDRIAQTAMTQGALTSVLLYKALVDGGASTGEALRLSTVAQITAGLGEQALEDLGIPTRTAMRHRADLRRLLGASTMADDPAVALPELTRIVLASAVRDA